MRVQGLGLYCVRLSICGASAIYLVRKTGDMVHPETPPHVGVVERSLQILQQRIDRGVVTWPPP